MEEFLKSPYMIIGLAFLPISVGMYVLLLDIIEEWQYKKRKKKKKLARKAKLAIKS